MRILCCLNRVLASSVALNRLLPALAGHELRIGLTEQVGAAAAADDEPPGRRELRIAEQFLPNRVLFPALELGRPGDGAPRDLGFDALARLRGLEVRVLPRPNAGEDLEWIRDYAPDLVLTIRYGAILKAPVIAIPRHGVVNLHSGLLPAYRGVLATFRALLNGDSHIGCTAHYISDGTIDTGAILGTARLPVRRDRSLLWHILALYEPGTALLADIVRQIAAGTPPPAQPQPAGHGAYYTYPTPQDWAAFAAQGWAVVEARDLHEAFARYLPAGA